MECKILEKLLLVRLAEAIADKKPIPEHQFRFKKQHSTIEQVHRLVNEINKTFENKGYHTTAFLDVNQAFDEVWHGELQYKIKTSLPHPHYII